MHNTDVITILKMVIGLASSVQFKNSSIYNNGIYLHEALATLHSTLSVANKIA